VADFIGEALTAKFMSKTEKYRGVLLAAGKGSRMAAFSSHIPKPMLPVGNKPLLVHQIEMLREVGITDIVVLIGYKGFEIARVLGDGSSLGVQLTYVEQTETLGIAHAVGQLENSVDKPFLMFLGDIYFVAKDIEEMFAQFERQAGGAVLATKIEEDPLAIRRNYSVQLEEDGRVVRVVEKPRHVSNKLKGVGLYLFDLTIFDAIRRTPRTAMRDEYEITEAIQVLINDGEHVSTVNAVYDDVNLTFPADLLRVNLALAQGNPDGNLIAEDAEVAPSAQLTNTVVGSGARVLDSVVMTNCVVFEGAVVASGSQYSNVIVTREKVVGCQEHTEGG
jgi:dTDP-glucose pyrophosphorylase